MTARADSRHAQNRRAALRAASEGADMDASVADVLITADAYLAWLDAGNDDDTGAGGAS